MIFFKPFYDKLMYRLLMGGMCIMDVMFYVTIILLGIIMLSGIGYLIHYYVSNRESLKRGGNKVL